MAENWTADGFFETAERYFRDCDERDRLYGEAGLCLALSAEGGVVTLQTLRAWYDGECAEDLCNAVRLAYLRIQEQIESDPRYRSMASRGMLMQKQPRLGGYSEKAEPRPTVRVIFGENMDMEDLK